MVYIDDIGNLEDLPVLINEECGNPKVVFDVYRDTFFSHVEKLMKGETSKMQSYRFKVWNRTTSAFFQRKAEEESEIWSNIYRYIVYDAIQIQVSESLSLNGDHIKFITYGLSFHRREERGLYGNTFFRMKYLKSISNIPTKFLLRNLIIAATYQDMDFAIITGWQK